MRRGLPKIYQFTVTLSRIDPPVWRRIQVPSSYSFWDLHVAIQDAMGWQDYHLHEFRITNPVTGTEDRIGIPDEEAPNDPCLPGWKQKIDKYFNRDNPSAIYLYDFGDDWEHHVTLDSVQPADARLEYPRCIAGARACPPEDVGGPRGYREFLAAVLDGGHPEHERMLEWVGGPFDAESFDLRQVRFDDPLERWRIAFEE